MSDQYTPHTEELLTIREVAEQLRVDHSTARRWVKQGVLEAVVLPHRNTRQVYRVRKSTIEKLLSDTTGGRALP